jgi:hypothetical protein
MINTIYTRSQIKVAWEKNFQHDPYNERKILAFFFSDYLGEWSDRAKNLSLPPYFHKQNYQTHGGHI